MLGVSLFGAVKLTTDADPGKYKYSSYVIGFDLMLVGLVKTYFELILKEFDRILYKFQEATEKNLSLHYNGVNSYIFVNGVEIYKFKAKDSEINAAPSCLVNVSKDFSINYDSIDIADILDIQKYLMVKSNIKTTF